MSNEEGAPSVEGYEVEVCECEIDWRCGLHRGLPTPIELSNHEYASIQTDIDRQNGV